MKRKHILLLTLLLTQTASLWGMNSNDFEEQASPRQNQRFRSQNSDEEESLDEEESQEEEIRYTAELAGPIKLGSTETRAETKFKLRSAAGEEVIRDFRNVKVKIKGFEFTTIPDISNLDPRNPLPRQLNFGPCYKQASYKFTYNNQEYKSDVTDTFTPYKHEAHFWRSQILTQEDLEVHKSRFDLVLQVRLESHKLHTAIEVPKTLDHVLVPNSIGNQEPSKLYYDGDKVSLREYRSAKWRAPRLNGEQAYTYDGSYMDASKSIPTHADSEVVYVETIPVPGERIPTSPRGYGGNYDYPSVTLAPTLIKGKLNSKYLIYSDGTQIFEPKVTHELWTRNEWRVGVGIASYKNEKTLSFLPDAKVPNNRKLDKGLYRLFSVTEKQGARSEIWRRLGKGTLDVEIKTPAGVGSIPGFMTRYIEPWK